MKVVLVGAGNLATNVGKAFCGAGHEVLQVYSRTEASASALAAALHCPWCTSLSALADGADLYLIAVKDAVLRDVAEQVAKEHPDRWLVHTAGSMPIDTLPSARRGVFYPMQTFSKQREADFCQIPCFVEASNAEDEDGLKALASTLSERVYVLNSENRQFLHLAAVFCCNFANHCFSLGAQLLKEHGGIPFDVMLPLIDETARKLHTLTPQAAQTGPAIRWDTNVINKQMGLLASQPDMQKLYELLSMSIHQHQ